MGPKCDFPVGSVVRCKDVYGYERLLTLDGLYTVVDPPPHREYEPAGIYVVCNDNIVRWTFNNRWELVELATPVPHDRTKGKVASDGGSTDYYKIPSHATELRHLISAKGMSKSRGDIFKACYRLGEKEGVDVLYDLNKMKFFVEDLIEMYQRGEHI